MSELTKRPRSSWDLRSVPWTDGKGNQEGYVNAVNCWESFHDKLPSTNSIKIPSDLRGIVLHSHLYKRAKDLCKTFHFQKLKQKESPKYARLFTKRMIYLLLVMIIVIFKNFCQQKEAIAKAFATSRHDLQHTWLKSSHTKQKLYSSQLLLSCCFPIAA